MIMRNNRLLFILQIKSSMYPKYTLGGTSRSSSHRAQILTLHNESNRHIANCSEPEYSLTVQVYASLLSGEIQSSKRLRTFRILPI